MRLKVIEFFKYKSGGAYRFCENYFIELSTLTRFFNAMHRVLAKKRLKTDSSLDIRLLFYSCLTLTVIFFRMYWAKLTVSFVKAVRVTKN